MTLFKRQYIAQKLRIKPSHKSNTFALTALISTLLISACDNNTSSINHTPSVVAKDHPNILIFYVEGLGNEDLSVYAAKNVMTPNIDNLAHNGLKFTNAHSYSIHATASHYSLLTGDKAVGESLTEINKRSSTTIPENKATLASMLKNSGYNTAFIGQWLLGLGDLKAPINWNEKTLFGPSNIGFSYSFITADIVGEESAVFLEDQFALNLSSNIPVLDDIKAPEDLELIKPLNNGEAINSPNVKVTTDESRYLVNTNKSELNNGEMLNEFSNMANFFIEDNKNTPFFLFISLTNKDTQKNTVNGTSAIAQIDTLTGEIVNQLKKADLLDNTLLIFTGSNNLSAAKSTPTILHFPNKVTAGVSDARVNQIDLYASLSSLLSLTLKNDEAVDSKNKLADWLNTADKGENK